MLVVPSKGGSPDCDPSPLTPRSPLLLLCKHGTMGKWELPVSTGVSLASLSYRVMERSPLAQPSLGILVIVKAHLRTWPSFWSPTTLAAGGRAHLNGFRSPHFRDFPGGAVVGNLPANAGDTGSSPGPGRSHMPRSN